MIIGGKLEDKIINKRVKFFRFLLFGAIIAILVFLVIKAFPFMKNISTREGQEAFREQITSMGVKGTLLLFALQLLQILLVVFPGEPFEILAGMCYGSVGGTIFIFISVFISTVLIYFLIKKYKEKYLYNFFAKEKVQKILNSKWYKSSKKTESILIILFFIPGIPKDLLVYMGPLLNIKPLKFILIATFARFPSVISSTMVGANIIYGDWKSILVIYLITAIFAGLSIFLLQKVDKENDSIGSV